MTPGPLSGVPADVGHAANPLSRTALRIKRLRPSPGQLPVKIVWSRRQRREIPLFNETQCEPMPAARPLSANQIAALAEGRRLRTHAECVGCGAGVLRKTIGLNGLCQGCADQEREEESQERDRQRLFALREFCAPTSGSTIYFDAETTGLCPDFGDELLEIAVVDDSGETLIETLLCPVHRTAWPEAEAIHGISPAATSGAPRLADMLPRLLSIVAIADRLVIYNAPFDLGFLPEPLRGVAIAKATCAMEAFALFEGDWIERFGAYRLQPLWAAAARARHNWGVSAPHRAGADSKALRTIWLWLCAQNNQLPHAD